MRERPLERQVVAIEDTRREPFRLEWPEWQKEAACRGSHPDLFFPERGAGNRQAKQLCSGCPVRQECDDFGSVEQFGIWGGRSKGERWEARARRRLAELGIDALLPGA